MKTKLIAFITTMLFSAVSLMGSASAMGIYQSGSVGNDVSWPNCSAKAPGTSFGIVGVTGGLGFSPNNCLTKELTWFKNQSLYVNTGYPGQSYAQKYKNYPNICTDTDLNCLAYNYGYAAGQYAVNYATSQNVSSNTWWLDVETMNSWTSDINQNKNSLQGEADALKNAGVTTLGYYSTTAQWQTITGGWRNGLPNWGASTWTTAKQAAKYCTGHEFTGGTTWLIQFSGKLDQNYAC